MQPEDWYSQNNIQVHLGDSILAIDRVNKSVTSAKGTILSYDYLIIATGSESSDAFVPPIPRVRELEGIFVYRTVADVKNIIEYATGKSKAAVIGGGE
jgi:nitrite reductase (NADH) large subunit